ncbi:uncharacterized protein LOC135829331 [Sycon ciliatum]|uniref:uncharacterized protein LOC135829331 n=1 Tax=Sycon ciliatum TaxID=27933 RepID=UPI0031F6FAB2
MKRDQLRATLKTNVASLCQRLEDSWLCKSGDDAGRLKEAAATAKSIPEWQDIILTVKLAIKERFLMGYLCDPEVQTALLRVDMARLKKTSVTPGYPREWEFFVSKAESYGQLLLLWRLLSESIDWRSSIKAVKCRVCKQKGDLDNMLVCVDCNGCWHTTCKTEGAPKLDICYECKLFNRQYREASALVHESFISDAESADTSDGYTTEEYCFDSAAEDGDSDLDYCHDNGDDRHGCASGDAAKKAIKMKCKTARPPQNLAAAEEQEAFHLSRAIALSRATHARRPKRGMSGQHRISPLLRGESVVTPTSTESPAASPSESVCLNMDESGSFEFSNPESVTSPDDDDDDTDDVTSDSSLDDSDVLLSDSSHDNDAFVLSDSCHDDNYAAPGNDNDVVSSDGSHGDNGVLPSDSSCDSYGGVSHLGHVM